MIPINVMFDAITKILMEYGPNVVFQGWDDESVIVYSDNTIHSMIGYIDENGFIRK